MPIGFTGSPLQRLEHERFDPDVVAHHRASPAAKLLDLDGLDPRVSESGDLSLVPLAEAVPPGDTSELALLGSIDRAPVFVRLPTGARGKPMFALIQLLGSLPPEQAATYGAARSLVDWHARHRFCARCGAAAAVSRAGWGRQCPACAAEHFPRTDPVVIMVAEHGGRALVGRQPRFPKGRYSALAGFVEVGESVEEAVARELFEEAGVRAPVSDVRYVASQPWPFPSSQLMLACIAKVESAELALDTDELEDAIWVSREGVEKALTNAPDAPFLAPPPSAIAHELLARWAREPR
jgi:NAD+ diphosphatase